MTDKKSEMRQIVAALDPDVRSIAAALEALDMDGVAGFVRRQQAELETLRAGYDAARLEIESLRGKGWQPIAKAASAEIDWHGATEDERQEVRDGFGPAYRAMLAAAPAQPAAQHGAAYAALPEFDSLDDDLIDAACSAGGLYRVDLMRAWNVLREARASHGQAPAGAAGWWRECADKIELQVALSGSSEAMRCYTDMRTLLQAAAAQADSVREDAFKLLNEVAQCFTADDDLPDNLLPRIDAVIAAIAAQEGKSHG